MTPADKTLMDRDIQARPQANRPAGLGEHLNPLRPDRRGDSKALTAAERPVHYRPEQGTNRDTRKAARALTG